MDGESLANDHEDSFCNTIIEVNKESCHCDALVNLIIQPMVHQSNQ